MHFLNWNESTEKVSYHSLSSIKKDVAGPLKKIYASITEWTYKLHC